MTRTSFKPISLYPNDIINYRNERYVITNILDLGTVLAKNLSTLQSRRILVEDITPESVEIDKNLPNNLLMIEDENWDEANRRFKIIKPILDAGKGNRVKAVGIASKEHGTSMATLYRWIKNYEVERRVSSLVRPTRKDKGSLRLDPNVEKIIEKHIKKSYLTDQKLTPISVWKKIKSDCRDQNLEIPHANTIRNRIGLISLEEKTLKRLGKDAARDKFKPIKGQFPNADFPLAVVQIDHTPMDIIIVDDDERKPIGRPNLTLAIDVHSKVVHGYYIGLDPVGALSTGLCMAHAILPKETWMAKMDLTGTYPIWGKMRVIHSDNAKEFKGTMLTKACKEHDIVVEKRPKGQPNYGGHIERAFRTYMSEVHTLPGTTRSNIADRGSYDSEGKACMTLAALEQWFAIFVTEVYHYHPHKGNNGVPPITMYERGLLGNDNQPGIGLPERIADEYKFKLDFLPFEIRTVQEYGIVFDELHYYHDGLRRWMHSIDPEDRKRKQKFVCRYDPRNLNKLYFYEPDTSNYIEVPFRDITRPPISIWELRAAKKRLKEDGFTEINEDMIFNALKKMDAIVETEKTKTKNARKLEARRKNWGKSKEHTAKPTDPNTLSIVNQELDDIFSEPISPFEDIEEAE